MSACVLMGDGEVHKAINVKCSTRKYVSDTSTFGHNDSTEVGRTTTCKMITDTKPKLMNIYELKCKDVGTGCKRFQVTSIMSSGNKFQVSGTCLSDEEL
jgi:hypothetical protein